MTAKVISICNLKGGVGKTTLVMTLAEYLAGDTIYDKRVLLIDLDPQTNLTSAMMSEDVWEWEYDQKGLTLPFLLKNVDYFLEKPHSTRFIVQDQVSNVRNKNSFNCLHLIPSSPRLFDVQEYLPANAVAILHNILTPLKEKYDYVLIDCPPSINNVIKSAFYASDFCLIPCVPSRMSIHGLELLLEKLRLFKKEYDHHITPMGTIISRYNGTSSHAHNLNFITVNPLLPPTFTIKIPERSKISEGLDFEQQLTYKQKYGDVHETMIALAKEFMYRVDNSAGFKSVIT
ncbi:ParA family protein [Raphidiopsis sp. BLCC-F218]